MKFFMYFCAKIKKIMRKSNKEILYKAAFRLFLVKQFEGVSLSDIEKESGLTRGAIFYYANDKKDLFHDIIKHFVIDRQNISAKVNSSDYTSVRDYINLYIKGVRETMDSLYELLPDMSRDNASRAYVSTILEASTFFPDVNTWYRHNVNNDISMWVSVLHKGVENGEIREDIDFLNSAKQFVCIYYGLTLMNSFSDGLNTNQLLEQMLNFYDFIKK